MENKSKICVIGNSQAGALKSAYSFNKDVYPGVKFSFWTIPSGSGPHMKIIENKIYAQNPKDLITDIPQSMEEGLDLEHFDAVVLSGVGIPAIRTSNKIPLHQEYAVAGLLNKHAITTANRQIISKSAYSVFIRHVTQNFPSFENIRKIANIYKKPIYIQMFPLPTKEALSQKDADLNHYGDKAFLFLSFYYQVQFEFLKSICCEQIHLIDYDESWIKAGKTPCEYKTDDAWHMNEKFGTYVLDKILSIHRKVLT